jgi:hypothetical protein
MFPEMPRGSKRVREILDQINSKDSLEDSPIYQLGYKDGYKAGMEIEGRHHNIALRTIITLYQEDVTNMRED